MKTFVTAAAGPPKTPETNQALANAIAAALAPVLRAHIAQPPRQSAVNGGFKLPSADERPAVRSPFLLPKGD